MNAAKEIQQWADRCLAWSKKARSEEQRATLIELERFLRSAAFRADDTSSEAPPARPRLVSSEPPCRRRSDHR
jgi:hypothetical protein